MASRFSAFILITLFTLQLNAQEVKVYIKDLSPEQGCETLTSTFNTEFFPTPIDSLIINYGDGNSDTIPNPVYGGNHTHTYNAVNDYTITLTGIKSGYTTGHSSKTVFVHPLPNANFSQQFYGYPALQDTFYFSNQRYLFIADQAGDTTHTWTINGELQYSNTDSMGYNFKTIGTHNISHSIVVNGCSASYSSPLVIVAQEIKIPNVFSPNNDGINDLFYIQTDGEMVYEFTVLDRNGSRVFTSEAKIISWDGRSYWGELLNPGNYYYSLKPTTGEIQTGIIYLAR